jgi:hypothetical protein
LFGIGQSVSGFQSPTIGYVLMGGAVLWAAWYLWESWKHRQERPEEPSLAPEAATEPLAQGEPWRSSQHGLLSNAMHYMEQEVDEQMRRATQPTPSLAQNDDRLAVAIYGEEQKEIQRRAEQQARENVDLQERRRR